MTLQVGEARVHDSVGRRGVSDREGGDSLCWDCTSRSQTVVAEAGSKRELLRR